MRERNLDVAATALPRFALGGHINPVLDNFLTDIDAVICPARD
jgi:hypothetical protein